MKIAVTGGKGGTGKSTVATSLACILSKERKVLLVDADVDCPNDHLILGVKRKKVRDVFQPVPVFDFSKCRKCGRCAEVCREKAIIFFKDKFPVFIPEQCIGCSSCMIACPFGAIGKGKKKIGAVYSGKQRDFGFLSAETEIGVEEESPVVNSLKEYSKGKEGNYDFVLVDTSPGTHCNVISALQGCDLALCVTEPTPLGAHDLRLSLDLLKILKIPAKIVLNKSDVGDKKEIEKLVKKYRAGIIGEIPYSRKIIKAYSRGEVIEDKSLTKISDFLKNGL
jgi:MinD superfamily P-loop ATPase